MIQIAGDLLASGTCTSQCLLAVANDSDCSCPCAGTYHGALTATEVEACVGQWWKSFDPGKEELDRWCPLVEWWSAPAGQRGKRFRCYTVQTEDQRFLVVLDMLRSVPGDEWPAALAFVNALKAKGRARAGAADNGLVTVEGIASLREAQVIGRLLAAQQFCSVISLSHLSDAVDAVLSVRAQIDTPLAAFRRMLRGY